MNMHYLRLINEFNMDGVKVRIDWNRMERMYEISAWVGGVYQPEVWTDYDFLSGAHKYAEDLFEQLLGEFA